jgi:undecaprenyl-diphosphatase
MITFQILAAKYLVLLGPLLALFVVWRSTKMNRRSLLLRAVATAILATTLLHIVAGTYFEQRPFVRLHTVPLIPHAANNSFPSDYVMIAACAAFLLYSYSVPVAVLATIAALVVGWARIATLLESPLDVIVSFALASVTVFIAHVLIRRKPKTGRSVTKLRAQRMSAAPKTDEKTDEKPVEPLLT